MNPHKLTLHFALLCLVLFSTNTAGQKIPSGGRIAVVVDERLAALRASPELNGRLVRRISRGRLVAIRSVKTTRSGVVFYFVNVSSRTHGWIQREAVVSAFHVGDDARLLSLIKESVAFDRIVRARIFLERFPRSTHRAEVLLLIGDTAEEVSEKLSKEARRRREHLMAPESSYFLNYPGLDRYNRQGVTFVFEATTRRLHYDGAAWREIVRRYPSSSQSIEAKKRLAEMLARGD